MTELIRLAEINFASGETYRDSNGTLINPTNGTTLSSSFGFADPSLAVGLTTVTQFSSELPFINLLHQSNFDALFGFAPNNGSNQNFLSLLAQGNVSADGTLLSFPNEAGTLFQAILRGLPEGALKAGKYILTYEGNADPTHFDIEGGDINFAESTPGRLVIDITESDRIAVIFEDPAIELPLRITSLVHEENLALHDAGAIFNPDFLDLFQDYRAIRFVTWMGTNNSTQTEFADLATIDDLYWGIETTLGGNLPSGVPLEVMIDLANQLGADPWFNIPHAASDEYIREFARTIRDTLEPGLVAHIEYSNEVWNFGFNQARFALEQGNALFGNTTTNFQSFVYYGFRSAQVQEIFREEFGVEAYEERIHGVLATQTVNLGVLEGAIEGVERYFQDNQLAQADVSDYFDSVGVTGYFGVNFGDQGGPVNETEIFPDLLDLVNRSIQLFNTGVTASQFEHFNTSLEEYYRNGTRPVEFQSAEFSEVELNLITNDNLRTDFAANAAIATQNGLELIQYEGGLNSVLDIGRFLQPNPQTGIIDEIGLSQDNLDQLIVFVENFFQSVNVARLQAEALTIFRQTGSVSTLANDFNGVSGREHISSDNFGTRNTLFDQGSAQAFVFDQYNVGAIDANGNTTIPSAAAQFGSINNDRQTGAFNHGLTVIGTSASESIFGSVEEDVLIGAAGNDALTSGDGADSLNGGSGNDILTAGNGDDTLIGGTQNDRLAGNQGNDLLLGDLGNDILLGGDGNDTLLGGNRNDSLNGGSGNDLLNGGRGIDTLIASAGSDTLRGGADNDILLGGLGNDLLFGGTQNDILFAESGNDVLLGEFGNDRLSGGDGNDTLLGGNRNDTLNGNAGNDLLVGGSGNDALIGGGQNDRLLGGTGNDQLNGSAGFDTLIGGSGNDTLTGAFNADTFLFTDGFGTDIITDFSISSNAEKIDLSGVTAIQNFADLQANHLSSDINGSALITVGNNSITLTGIAPGTLSVDDFVF